jgi:excisionase family DNA binding protein
MPETSLFSAKERSPMKNHPIQPNYLSTSQAAKMLGLSVGTIQRMVENGVFKAFVTQGGHRRILSSSLNQYCKQKGVAGRQAVQEMPLLCILHDSQHMLPALEAMAHWAHVKVMTHPLDLMGVHPDVEVFFIDARIPWLHTTPMHLQDNLMQNAHIVVYNSAHLPSDSPLHLAKKIKLFEGDISADLVDGYLLGHWEAKDTGMSRPLHQ